MCDAIAVVGPGYKSATFEELRGPILQAEKKDIGARLIEIKQSWENTGCTVMSKSGQMVRVEPLSTSWYIVLEARCLLNQ